MDEEFTCPICLEIAENAVETSCCHRIFCESCLQRMMGLECPQCRSEFEILISHVPRRIIGNMPTTCSHKNCNAKLTRSNVKDHERMCTYRVYVCPASMCSYMGERDSYLNHLVKEHGNKIADNAAICFNSTIDTASYSLQDDVVATKKNSAGRSARIGENGKYYCTGSLGSYRCGCCDGHCGPTNGCNCQHCMKLDIRSRKLPPNFYVNREGASCRLSRETGTFYCGRKVMQNTYNCDGYCGPTNGPNCFACRIMQDQYSTRYAGIW